MRQDFRLGGIGDIFQTSTCSLTTYLAPTPPPDPRRPAPNPRRHPLLPALLALHACQRTGTARHLVDTVSGAASRHGAHRADPGRDHVNAPHAEMDGIDSIPARFEAKGE
ncbi:hypothetical protein BT67DRAFT_439694 [Trichocladium antarcticum]|uniref:Uncharacterized protein n=1 Tax=Trichocladium antarcticum TaxID=1450529 RepID=A0AAN6UQ81_9PEZI|nr:hypothetical protein BT67DRAFT_439694 [Trichocladium antarcticum]